MDRNSKAPSSKRTSTGTTLDDKDSTAFLANTTVPFVADSGSEITVNINHQFDNIDFVKVQVEGANLEVCTEPMGKEQRRAVIVLHTTMGRIIDGFNLPDLSPFPIFDMVLFLRFPIGTANKYVYEGSYSLDTMDYPGCTHHSK